MFRTHHNIFKVQVHRKGKFVGHFSLLLKHHALFGWINIRAGFLTITKWWIGMDSQGEGCKVLHVYTVFIFKFQKTSKFDILTTNDPLVKYDICDPLMMWAVCVQYCVVHVSLRLRLCSQIFSFCIVFLQSYYNLWNIVHNHFFQLSSHKKREN